VARKIFFERRIGVLDESTCQEYMQEIKAVVYSFVRKDDAYCIYSSFAPFIKGLRLTIIFSFYFFIVVKGS
jgi:hypothetical protein